MEIWKDIKGFEGLYQISNYGNIKSLERTFEYIGKNQFGEFKTIKKHKEMIIKQSINGNGYYQVCLRKENIKKNLLVHRLIAEAIEYIENHFLYHYGSEKRPVVFEDNYIQEIVDILRGEDNESN